MSANKYGEDVGNFSQSCSWIEMQNSISILEKTYKLFKILPHNPADPELHFQEKNENIFHTEICIQMFTAALCVIARSGSNPKVHHGWVNVMYIHKIEHYSEVQRNELLIHSWMNPGNIMLIKEASHKRPHFVWLHLNETLRIGRSAETEKEISVCLEAGRGWGKPVQGFLLS